MVTSFSSTSQSRRRFNIGSDGGENCSTRMGSDSESEEVSGGRRSNLIEKKTTPCNLSLWISRERESRLMCYQKLEEEVMKNYEPIKLKAESAAQRASHELKETRAVLEPANPMQETIASVKEAYEEHLKEL